MPYPPASMAATWVVMCPMDYSALEIPLVIAAEGNGVSYTKGVRPWRDVDVVSNQQSLPGSQFDNEPLMATRPRNFFSVKVFRMDLEADFKRLFGVVFWC